MLYKRILTAVILIPLVLAGIYYLSELYFQIFVALIMLGCAWEWTHLMQLTSKVERVAFLLLIAVLCYAVRLIPMVYYLSIVAVVLLYCIWQVHRYQKAPETVKLNVWAWYSIGIVLFTATWLALNVLRFRTGGTNGMMMLLLLVWFADTAAYFTGKYLGKRKLASQVSPNKSWEGIYGAAAAVLVLTLIEAAVFQFTFFRFAGFLLLNFMTFIFAVYGDLFESMMKRIANCKDSGGLLPGHGGLLDRLDSLFFAAPIFTLGSLVMVIGWQNLF